MASNGKLFLIPTYIADDFQRAVIPDHIVQAIPGIRHFVVENVRTARRYLGSLKIYESIESLNFSVLDKDTSAQAVEAMMQPLLDGFDVGVLSESGCPGVADPGARAVAYAHRHKIQVVPLVGPSSILLALMASGLNGQKFAFHGYLPIDSNELSKVIKVLEDESRKHQQTQIFIETPYRNNQMLKSLLQKLGTQTQLCIALDITGSNEMIATKTVKEWRDHQHELLKKPAVFLFKAP